MLKQITSVLLLVFIHFSFCNGGRLRDEIFSKFEYDDEHSENLKTEIVEDNDVEVGEYCAAFIPNYQYYCKGIWSAEKLHRHRRIVEKISGFCASYKSACVTRGKEETRVFDQERQNERHESLTAEVRELTYDEIMRKIEKITPCRPNCDIRRHPHCTRKCKCEYEYKRVRKWCRPSTEDRYKNFCRIWQMSCSGYIDPSLEFQ